MASDVVSVLCPSQIMNVRDQEVERGEESNTGAEQSLNGCACGCDSMHRNTYT